MRVKAITDYNDLELNRIVEKDEELEVEDARANILMDAKVAVLIPQPVKRKANRKKDEVSTE